MRLLNKRRGVLFYLLFFFLSFSFSVKAQENDFTLSFTPYFDYYYTSNVFWDYEETPDTVYSPGFILSLSSYSINMYLSANTRRYMENAELNSTQMRSGFEYFIPIGSRSFVFFSTEVSSIMFKEDYNYLNRTSPEATVGIKKYITKTALLRSGLRVVFNKYYNYSPYDHIKTAFFIEGNKFLKTQTTLRFTAGFNNIYFQHLISEDIEYYYQIITTRGRNKRTITIPQITYNEYSLSIPQIYFTARLSQGIMEKTGITFEAQYRKNFEDFEKLSSFIEDEWILSRMNDDFFWEGKRLSFALKTIAILQSTISFEVSYLVKDYSGVLVRDLVGEPILPAQYREDSLLEFSFLFEKRYKDLNFYIKGIVRKNSSNDLFFDYSLFTIMSGIDYTF